MNAIHDIKTLPRFVGPAEGDAGARSHGSRQTGKSALAERLVQGERRYRSLSKVQRESGLLLAVKSAIDNRTPGRFC